MSANHLPAIWSIILIAFGLVLAVLGYEGTFTLTGCGTGAISCVRSYYLNFLSIFVGVISLSAGAIVLIRSWLSNSSK